MEVSQQNASKAISLKITSGCTKHFVAPPNVFINVFFCSFVNAVLNTNGITNSSIALCRKIQVLFYSVFCCYSLHNVVDFSKSKDVGFKKENIRNTHLLMI